MKPVRFLPLVALAAFSLLALKMAGMLMGDRYMLTGTGSTLAKVDPDAPEAGKAAADGKSKEKAAKAPDKAVKSRKDKNAAPTDVTSLNPEHYRSKAEISLLISLSKRRKQLEKREQELGLRLNLIKAAEKRIDQRIALLKGLETKIQRFAKVQKEEKKTQFAMLVKMYSSMKPKGAARIFNELDKKVLLGIIQNMKPQAMSAILAAMAPEKAREMTISLAGMTQQKFTEKSLDALPKINGK